jgi:hypothetical protein
MEAEINSHNCQTQQSLVREVARVDCGRDEIDLISDQINLIEHKANHEGEISTEISGAGGGLESFRIRFGIESDSDSESDS